MGKSSKNLAILRAARGYYRDSIAFQVRLRRMVSTKTTIKSSAEEAKSLGLEPGGQWIVYKVVDRGKTHTAKILSRGPKHHEFWWPNDGDAWFDEELPIAEIAMLYCMTEA